MMITYMVITGMLAAGTFFTYRARGWAWVSIGLVCATVFLGLGSIIEALVLRIELTDEALIVTDLRGRRRYDIADIEGIEEARGVAPALKLKDGTGVKLPSVGDNVGNSVRSWLKQHSAKFPTMP